MPELKSTEVFVVKEDEGKIPADENILNVLLVTQTRFLVVTNKRVLLVEG